MSESAVKQHSIAKPYMQNRELSWLDFDERVLDQGSDPTVPLLERLNFVSIFWSNLQEFFMVRVGSLTDLALVNKNILDTKTGWTPQEQLDAIYNRCHELYPVQERVYESLRKELAGKGIKHCRPEDLAPEQEEYVNSYFEANVAPFLSPQIINSRHPFPHLENGALYVVVRLNEAEDIKQAKAVKDAKDTKGKKAQTRNLGAVDVTLGLIPMPRGAQRLISLPGDGYNFILLEHVIEMNVAKVFSMYRVKHSNVICVTRNADIDVNEGVDEAEDVDYREFMKRLLKKRGRLAPVRLELQHPIRSKTLEKTLLKRLGLKKHQVFVTSVPLNLGFTWGLGSKVPGKQGEGLVNAPMTPQWTGMLDPSKPVIEQVQEHDVIMSYPYESMDPFVQMLREASTDPSVISIKITLYRLASQSHLAEALIAAAENGKQVTALFELRARFDENNNIEWSQRFEEAGCNVIYGFRDYKVHSKICCITRQTPDGLQYITQLGTGNYNEKTAKLYTDFSFITSDEGFGRDAARFFHNMALENTSNEYDILRVAPLQIKPMILVLIDREIAKVKAGEPAECFFKTNSVTDKDVIEKIVEASQAGVKVTMLVRGISCLVPGVPGYTDNVRVLSIVGRLLEHSRIYAFGPRENCNVYLSSADLMTRNMDKRIEIAWPVLDLDCKERVLSFVDVCLSDNAKLRELKPDTRYTPYGSLAKGDPNRREAHEILIRRAVEEKTEAAERFAEQRAKERHQRMLDKEAQEQEREHLAEQEREAAMKAAAARTKATEPVQETSFKDPEAAQAAFEPAAHAVEQPTTVEQTVATPRLAATKPSSKPEYVQARVLEPLKRDVVPAVRGGGAKAKKGLGLIARFFRRKK